MKVNERNSPHPSSADADDTLSRKGRGKVRFARTQRAAMTRAEAILWRELRNRRLGGFKFRRQVPIGPYVVDFLCYEGRLIVELDGPPHHDSRQRDQDARRDAWLDSQGFRILRFQNDPLIAGSGQSVVDAVRQAMQQRR